MKKIFTLIATALMTMGASAQDYVIDGTNSTMEVSTITMTDPFSGGEIVNPHSAKQGDVTMYLLKADKTFGGGNTCTFEDAKVKPVKLSNGAPNAIVLPEGVTINKIEFIGYCNAADETSWISNLGVMQDGGYTDLYTSDGTVDVVTYLSKEDCTDGAELQKIVIDNISATGTIYFKNGGKQPAFIIRMYKGETGGSTGGDIQIYSEIESNTYAVTTTLDDLKAAFGEEKVAEAWGMGVWLPADYTLIDNDEMTMKTAVEQTPIYVSGNKFGDMQKEFPAYTGYMNMGSALPQNNWKGDEPAQYEEMVALKKNYHGIFAITPKVDGTLSFGVYAGDNSRSIGIIDWATEEEILNEQPSKFVAYKNFRHEGLDVEPAEGVEGGEKNAPAYVEGAVKAGRTYLLVGGDGKNLTMHQIKFIPGTGTGISNITTSNIQDDVIYTLQGQKVAKATKGIYIINGKKVVVK